MKLENIHVIFKDGDNWAEEVCFTDIINVIIEFIKKLVSFEFGSEA